MLAVAEVDMFPKGLNLMPWSRHEFEQHTPKEVGHLKRTSEFVWTVSNTGGETLLVVGVKGEGLIGDIPELYMLVCEEFRKNLRRNLVEVRELVNELLTLYPHVKVQVDAKFPAGQRFAEFMGFRKMVGEPERVKDREYIWFEVTYGH